MEKHTLYLLKQYLDADYNGIQWSEMRDTIMKRPEYLLLLEENAEDTAHSYLSSKGYVEGMRKAQTSRDERNKITANGIEAYRRETARENAEKKKEEVQQQLTQSIIDTNESSRITNESIRQLNEATKENFKAQKNLTKAIVAVTALSLLVSTATFFRTCERDRPQLLQLSPQTQQQLENILKYQKGIDSSLRKAVRDSFYQRK